MSNKRISQFTEAFSASTESFLAIVVNGVNFKIKKSNFIDPLPTPMKSDWLATSGISEILNKPIIYIPPFNTVNDSYFPRLRDNSQFGPIGSYSYDFSDANIGAINDSYGQVGQIGVHPSELYGALGTSTYAFGYNVSVQGYGDVVFGMFNHSDTTSQFSTLFGRNNYNSTYNTLISGSYNKTPFTYLGHKTVFGNGNIVNGSAGLTSGVALLNKSFGTTVLGQANLDYTNTEQGVNNEISPILIVGNGNIATPIGLWTSTSRSNALELLKNGLMTLPSVTNALITSDTTGKAVITKEYLNSVITTSESGKVTSVTNTDLTNTITGTSTNPIVSRTAITGDVVIPIASNVATLTTVNANVGIFGNTSNVTQSTVNAKGLTTAIANVPIQIVQSQVTGLVADLVGKQATLVSGTNIKTINGNALLGSGDVTIPTPTFQQVLTVGNTSNGINAIMDNATFKFTSSFNDSEIGSNSITFRDIPNNRNFIVNGNGGFDWRDNNSTSGISLGFYRVSSGVGTFLFPEKNAGSYTLTTTEDFKTINSQSIVGSGNISLATTSDLAIAKINEGNGFGYVIYGRDPLNFGNIGLNAIDLSSSTGASSTRGATGTLSVVGGGENNTASSTRATVSGGGDNTASNFFTTIGGGYGNVASGPGSVIGGGAYNETTADGTFVGGGSSNRASGVQSTVLNGTSNIASGVQSVIINGNAHTAPSFGEVVMGINSKPAASATPGSIVSTDRLYTLGNGTGTGTSQLSNAVEVYKNGSFLLPSITNALIDSGGNKSVITKEYLTATVSSGNYTPTFGTFSNGASGTVFGISSYTRVGNVVTATIGFEVAYTAANTDTAFTISLPVNRTSTLSYNIGSGAGVINVGGVDPSVSFRTQSNSVDKVTVIFHPKYIGGVNGSITIMYNVNN